MIHDEDSGPDPLDGKRRPAAAVTEIPETGFLKDLRNENDSPSLVHP